MTHPQLSSEQRRQLIEAALQVRGNAYAPYSHYAVGAALLTPGGEIYTGCNVENASFGATICAERTAVVKAVSEGAREFVAAAVVTANGGSPCGICRQVLYEFGPEMLIILVDGGGNLIGEFPLYELLAHGFGPKKLREGQ